MSNLAFQIEAVHTKSQKLRDLQHALYAAFYCQDQYSHEEFEWAFILLDEIANDVMHDMKDLTDIAFDEARERKKQAEESGVTA